MAEDKKTTVQSDDEPKETDKEVVEQQIDDTNASETSVDIDVKNADEEENIDIKEADEPIEDELLEEEPNDKAEGQIKEESTDDNKEVDELLKVERDDTPPADPHAAQAAAASAATKEEKERKAKQHPLIAKIKAGARYWWTHKKLRYGSFAFLFLAIVAMAAIPVTRYAALNIFGVRVGATVTVTNKESGLPLENIPVKLAGKEVRTNENGAAVFDAMKLGDNSLVIDKLGYAQVDRVVTLGLGSNPGVMQEIDATGAQYRFSLTQWLSDDAKVLDAKAQSGEDIARVNDQGELLLIVSDLSPEAEVLITAEGYREERIPVSELEQELTELEMVPSYNHAFVSNRSGEYDLYTISLDGENEELVLEATGKEREIPFAVQNVDGSRIAYISSRAGEENKDGFILDGLHLVQDGSEERITRSEQLQIVGWQGDNLVYVSVIEGVSAGNPQRSKIFSYNAATTERKELASANYFNDVAVVGEKVYYSVSSFAVPRSQAKLFSVDISGEEDRELVVNAQVWTIGYRDVSTLLFNAEERQWFQQDLSTGEVVKLDQSPSASASRNYVFQNDQALRVETRDGKGTLLMTNQEGVESTVLSESGISEPMKWINDNYAVYRVTTGSESADYVVRLDNGETQKIVDVVGNRFRNFY